MSKLLFLAAALSAAASFAAPDPQVPPTARVGYADLDLTKAAGKSELDRRIERALRTVCAEELQVSLSKRLDEIRCRRAALARIAPQRDRALARVAGQGAVIAETATRSASSAN